MMRVLLVSTYESEVRSFIKPQMGQIFIKKYTELHMKNVHIELIDPEIVSVEDVCHKIDECWDVIGFYTTYPTLVNSAKLINHAYVSSNCQKMNRPILIAGGPGVTYNLIFKMTPIDIAIHGEGEKTFVNILKCIHENKITAPFRKNNQDIFSAVYGSFDYRMIENDDAIIHNVHTDDVNLLLKKEELNEIIHLEKWEFEVHKKYEKWTREALDHEYGFPFYFTRGCNSNGCNFCSSYNFFRSRCGSRYPDVEAVCGAIEQMTRRLPHIRSIMIEDDNFIPSKSWTMSVFKQIIKIKEDNRIPYDTNFIYKTRIDQLDEDLLIISKMAGVKQINIGIESISENVLHEIGKTINYKIYTSKVKRNLEIGKKIGLKFHCYMIFFTPNMTYRDLVDNVLFAAELLLSNIEISCYDGLLAFPGSADEQRWNANPEILESVSIINPMYRDEYEVVNNIFHIKEIGKLPYIINMPYTLKPRDMRVNKVYQYAKINYSEMLVHYMNELKWKATTSYRIGIVKVSTYLKALQIEEKGEEYENVVDMYIKKLEWMLKGISHKESENMSCD